MNKYTISSSLIVMATIFTGCANAEYSVEEGSIFYTEPSAKTVKAKPAPKKQVKQAPAAKETTKTTTQETTKKVSAVKEVTPVEEVSKTVEPVEPVTESKYEHPVYEDEESEITTNFEGHYDQNEGDD